MQMINGLSNEELVLLYRENNANEVFNELLNRFKTTIDYLAANTYINGFDVDDLKIELQMSLYKCVCIFDIAKGYKLSTLFRNVAKNTILNLKVAHNKKVCEESFNVYLDTGREIEFIELTTTIDDDLDITGLLEAVKLTNNEKLVCKLLYEGYKQNEIAKIMQISAVRVNQYIKQLRKKFSEYLNYEQ